MAENIKAEVVIDASWIASFLLEDESSRESDDFFLTLKKSRTELIAPTLLQYEITNILRTALVAKRITHAQSTSLLSYFKKMNIEYYEIEEDFMLDVALQYRLSVYDASYLALALSRKASFMTHDKKLKKIYDSLK